MLIFAIGDIHGCHDKLASLLTRCRIFAGGRPHHFIFLGDYIDRGPDSSAVIEALIHLPSTSDQPSIFLRGNHEQMLLDALSDQTAELNWFINGGDTTLGSYRASSAAGIPAAHLAFLNDTRLSFAEQSRFFVHAGVNPARLLDGQEPHDLLWIREPFLSSRKDFGKLIVHGHTPLRTGAPDERPNRVNLDTAAVYGGPLTAAIFIKERQRPIGFIQSTDDLLSFSSAD